MQTEAKRRKEQRKSTTGFISHNARDGAEESALLLFGEGLRDGDGAAFAGLDGAAGHLIAVEFDGDGVDAGRNFDAGRSSDAGGDAVDPDFGAIRRGTDLSPGDVAVFLVEFGVNFGLTVGADFDLIGVGIVAGEAEDQIVFAWSEGKGDGSLAGLFVAIDEDVGAG